MEKKEKMIRRHLYIRGRVQGVGFRAFLRRQAKGENVKGWVKNLHDGRVEAVLSGTEKNVNRVINAARNGPSMARVHDLEVSSEEYQNEFNTFRVRF